MIEQLCGRLAPSQPQPTINAHSRITVEGYNVTYSGISIFESIQLFNTTLKNNIFSSQCYMSYSHLVINTSISIKLICYGNSCYESLSDSMGHLYQLVCC